MVNKCDQSRDGGEGAVAGHRRLWHANSSLEEDVEFVWTQRRKNLLIKLWKQRVSCQLLSCITDWRGSGQRNMPCCEGKSWAVVWLEQSHSPEPPACWECPRSEVFWQENVDATHGCDSTGLLMFHVWGVWLKTIKPSHSCPSFHKTCRTSVSSQTQKRNVWTCVNHVDFHTMSWNMKTQVRLSIDRSRLVWVKLL